MAGKSHERDLLILTADEAATVLGVSERRVRQLLDAGRIAGARKLGRDWAIPAPVQVLPPAKRVSAHP